MLGYICPKQNLPLELHGALSEQINLLQKHNIDFQIVPGIPAYVEAAAQLKTELTAPGQVQSVVLTRTSFGSTPMPEGEDLKTFAKTGAVSYLYYADRIYQINLAIAGVAVGTVSLPVLSKAFKKKNVKKISDIQNKSFELSLLFSIPASFGLILASNEIVNALFGYGSFTKNDVEMTATALKFFGYGVPAFALIKILSNFFFARDNTKTPFYVSTFIVFLNILISVIFFRKIGFTIIPIATSISTWIGVFIYIYLLNTQRILLLKKQLITNFTKILVSSILMTFVLIFSLDSYANNLEYNYEYKAIYLISIVSFVGMFYLISCYLLGILKLKNYKTK